MSTKEMRQKRAGIIEEAGKILTAIKAEGREAMSAEEEQRYDAMMTDADRIKATYERIERQEDAERALEESLGRRAEQNNDRREERAEGTRRTLEMSRAERGDLLRAWFLSGSDHKPNDKQMELAKKYGVNLSNRNMTFKLSEDPLHDVRDYDRWLEHRAQSVGTAGTGPELVPKGFSNQLEKALLAFGGMRQAASVIRTDSGNDLPWPTTNDTSNKGAILAENTAATELALAFSSLTFNAFKYTSRMILVSVELLQDSAINIEQYIGDALGTRIGRITNDHFTTGTGSGQPNGIVTAAASGKVGTTGQTTSIIYADLVDLQHSVDPAYRVNGKFMFHDTTLKALKKMLDSQSRPLWAPGIAVREPDTILGHPYVINQSMAVMAANAKSVIFGDLSKYMIRDVRDVTLLRLDERYAELHQVAFLAFSRHDGDLLDAGTNPVKYYANSAT